MKRALLAAFVTGCTVPDYQFADALQLRNEPAKTCANGGLCVDSAAVTDDANDDGVLNPGETATITVWARNGLARDATGVYPKLTDVPSGVSIRDCFSYYAECTGACVCSEGSIGFSLDAAGKGDLPLLRFEVTLNTGITTTELLFGIDLSDDYDQTWHDDFALAVTQR